MNDPIRVEWTDQTNGALKTADLSAAHYTYYAPQLEGETAPPKLMLYFNASGPITLQGRQATKAADLLESMSNFSLDDE